MVSGEGRERYTHGADPAEQRRLEGRTARQDAAFFLPHLRPGMRLLDVGCGPGSITLDLAAAVAPGEVVGLDVQGAQVERARALAAERGVATARFEVGDAYALPFPDAAFDAAFAHTLLVHLREPLAVLAEVRRVLRPGGVIGIADGDFGLACIEPASALTERGLELLRRVLAHNGGRPAGARANRGLLLAAGFVEVEASGVVNSAGTPEATRRFAGQVARMLREPAFGAAAAGQGWADRAEVAAMADAIEAVGERPDAFLAILRVAAVGRRPSR